MIASRWPWTVAIVLLFGFASNPANRIEQSAYRICLPRRRLPRHNLEVVVGGQFIKEVTEAFISGGIRAEVVGWYRPMTQGEYVCLNQKIRFKQEELKRRMAQAQ